jgi:ABC-type Fe2+-enterobactin transport system substrate-binding protein
MTADSLGGSTMSKILSTAVVAGLLLALAAPAIAADAPKTKTECDKLTDMKWDSKTKTCVKK